MKTLLPLLLNFNGHGIKVKEFLKLGKISYSIKINIILKDFTVNNAVIR
jgi:hypothetical protein